MRKLTLYTLALSIAMILLFAISQTFAAAKEENAAHVSVNQMHSGPKPVVVRSVRNDTSIPLRDMKPLPRRTRQEHEIPNHTMPKALAASGSRASGGMKIQNFMAPREMQATFENFDAQPNNCFCAPPDPNGDVGPNHYVTSANAQYQVFDKTGVSLLGPIDVNTIWSGFGGDCEDFNNGDPIVLYDHLADR